MKKNPPRTFKATYISPDCILHLQCALFLAVHIVVVYRKIQQMPAADQR